MKNHRKMGWGGAARLIGGMGVLGQASVACAQYAPEVIAYTRQPVDAIRTFELFDDPVINDDGNIAFWAWESIDTSANDECAGAIDVFPGVTTVGNHFASPTPQPAWCGTNDVWLRFTAINTGRHTLYGFLAVGTTNDVPSFTVYTGTCGSLTRIFENCGAGQPSDFDAVAGTTYFIRVGARTTPGAPQRLTVTLTLSNPRIAGVDSSLAQPRSHQRGVWIQRSKGGPELIVREGQTTPFDAERTFRSTYFPALGPGDDVALLGVTRGSGTTNEITRASLVRSGVEGALEEVVRDPEAPLWLAPVPQLNAAGRLAYTLNDGLALFYGEAVVSAGDHAPGTAKGVTFQLIDQPVSSDGAPIAFRARLQGPGVDDTNNLGLWADTGSGLQLVARTGDAAPGTNPGVVWSDLAIEPAVSDAGGIAFFATLTGTDVTPANNSGIWIGVPGALRLAARAGGPAAGAPGATFRSFNRQVRINRSRAVVVGASLTGKGIDATNNTGLWMMGAGGGTSILAREGDGVGALPGAALDHFFDPVLDDFGNVFVMARVRGAKIDPSNNEILLLARGASRWAIARSGDSVELPSMESKTVRRIVFGDWGAGAGRSATNHLRQIVYRTVFTDGTEALVRAGDECVADWNADGLVDSNDFFAFLTGFFAGNADINGDGSTSSQDFFDYLAAFFAGCE